MLHSAVEFSGSSSAGRISSSEVYMNRWRKESESLDDASWNESLSGTTSLHDKSINMTQNSDKQSNGNRRKKSHENTHRHT